MQNRLNKALAALALLLLVGCASNNSRQAEPVQVELPSATGPGAQPVSASIRTEFAAALEMLKNARIVPAKAAFETLVARQPQLAGAHLNLAIIHNQMQDYEAAEQAVQRAIKLAPRNAAAYNLHGTLLRRKGQFRDARLAYSKALLAEPDYAPAHLNIAILFDIYLQYWDDARDHYQRYLKLAGEDPTVSLWLMDLDMRIKREAK